MSDKLPDQSKSKTDNTDKIRVSRRGFLKTGGLFAAAFGLGAAACEPTLAPPDNNAPSALMPMQMQNQYPAVADAPMTPPPSDILHVFTPQEAHTVEALTARILPGTPDDPGAREAGVVTYIDNLLAFNEGYDSPTYRQPPFAQTYDGDAPPATPQAQTQYQTIWVKKSDFARYGFQTIMTPRETYRAGIAAVDRYANTKFGQNFVDLSEAQQDQIVADMAAGKTIGFSQPADTEFFTLLRTHTIEGMFSDPAYGGNRNMVGWQLIGYPGAQRAYTTLDIKTEGHSRAPQSLAMMHNFQPGQAANANVVLPVSGSTENQP